MKGSTVRTIEHDIHVRATPNDVWSVLADLGSFAEWSPVVRSVNCDGAEGVGATRSCSVSPMGQIHEEVVAWEPGRSLALRTTGGMPMEATATWSVAEDGSGANVSVALDYELKGGFAGRVMDHLLVHRQLDRNFARNLEGLRDHIESAD